MSNNRDPKPAAAAICRVAALPPHEYETHRENAEAYLRDLGTRCARRVGLRASNVDECSDCSVIDMYQPEHWQKWREKGFSRAWAAKCALNIALDFITGMNAIESRFISAEDCKPQYESHPDERTDMFSEIARKETDRELEAAIGELTPGQQEALRLRFFEDLSFPRIAELLGTTEDAVRMLVSRALPRLGKRLLKIRFNADAALAAYSSYAQ